MIAFVKMGFMIQEVWLIVSLAAKNAQRAQINKFAPLAKEAIGQEPLVNAIVQQGSMTKELF